MDQYTKMNEYLLRFTEYAHVLKSRESREKLEELSELRKIGIETLDASEVFWIGSMAEMMVPKFVSDLKEFGVISETNNKPIFHDRWIIPIKDSYGRVVNLVGYSNIASERYVYGTGKYYDRANTLYGLENIELAYEMGYAILVEGITDALSIRDLGYKNTYAACGTIESSIKMNILNRCRHGIIRIPDRDRAGDKTRRHWITNRYFTFNVPIDCKDSNDVTIKSDDNKQWMKECLDMAIEWILEAEHRGNKCVCEEQTML